ncbi:MAG: HD domain-containing phosphohydrolase [Verrucomicrobiota bacterium]|jgi:response regulator RpfG family c-di-GMP phosphodiesterase
MTDKILFVDDDANLLASCERNFRLKFAVATAAGGEAALEKIAAQGPFAVVIADRQMPRMDGITLLARIRERAPDTVRIMLTGNADMEGAIKVVNEGNIFRFLTKPCPPEILGKALGDALAQYRLVTAEKELLNRTLSGSIKLLTDILSTTDPDAFGRAQTVRDLINFVTKKFHVDDDWEIPLAVMLAPIGNVMIPPQLLIRARAGVALSRVEEQLLARVPETAARLLANIPRLEGVARIICHQHLRYDGAGAPPGAPKGEALPLGSRLLKILADLAQLQGARRSRFEALDDLQSRLGWYDPILLSAVREYHGLRLPQRSPGASEIFISLCDLAPGMLLRADVETQDGTLILCAGHQLTEMTLEKIKNFALISGIKEPLQVENPSAAKAENPTLVV